MSSCTSDFKALDAAWGLSTAVGSVAGNLADYAPLPNGVSQVARGVQKVANLAALPQFASQAVSFASKPSLIEGLSLVGAGCDGVLALRDIDVIGVGNTTLLGSCSNAITVVTGGYECVKLVEKRGKYQKAINNAPVEKIKSYYSSKKNLNLLSLIKKITSISLAVLGLLSLVLGSLSLFGVLLIAGSVVYLTLTIGECFYSKTLEKEKQGIAHLFKKG